MQVVTKLKTGEPATLIAFASAARPQEADTRCRHATATAHGTRDELTPDAHDRIKHTERETCSLYLSAGHTHHSTTDPEFSTALSLPNTPHTRMSCCCECATRIMLTDLGGPPLGHTHTAVADLISPPAAPALGTALQDQRGRGPVEVSTPAPVMRPGCL
jgi:hypothetical protein